MVAGYEGGWWATRYSSLAPLVITSGPRIAVGGGRGGGTWLEGALGGINTHTKHMIWIRHLIKSARFTSCIQI